MNSASSLAPEWESGFAYGRNEVSPDSEQIEHVIAEQFMRNSVSVERIQDRGRERGGNLRTLPFNARRSKAKQRGGIPFRPV